MMVIKQIYTLPHMAFIKHSILIRDGKPGPVDG